MHCTLSLSFSLCLSHCAMIIAFLSRRATCQPARSPSFLFLSTFKFFILPPPAPTLPAPLSNWPVAACPCYQVAALVILLNYGLPPPPPPPQVDHRDQKMQISRHCGYGLRRMGVSGFKIMPQSSAPVTRSSHNAPDSVNCNLPFLAQSLPCWIPNKLLNKCLN